MGKNKPLLWTAVLSAVGTTSAFAQITGTPAAGEYYFKDVATGKFLGQGLHWGTQATLNNDGLLFKVTLNNGKYTLDSNVNNGNKHFLGENGFVDSDSYGFEISELKDKPGQYVIKAGDKYLVTTGDAVTVDGTEAAKAIKWQIIPVADLKKAFEKASFEKPADASFLIKGSGFNAKHGENSAWTQTPANVLAFGGDTGSGATSPTGQCVEVFHKVFKAGQEITDVPTGLYRLKVQAFDRFDNWGGSDVRGVIYANDMKGEIPTIAKEQDNDALKALGFTSGTPEWLPNSMTEASKAFSAGLYWSDPVYVYVNDGKLNIGIEKTEAGSWVIFDNFSLEYIGDLDVDGTRAELTQKLAIVINKANKYTDDKNLQEYALEASQLQARINKLTTDNKDAYAVVGAYKSGTKGNIGEEIDNLSANIEKANANY